MAAQSNKIWQRNNSFLSREFNKSHSGLDNIVFKYPLSPSQQYIPRIVKILIERPWYETSIQIDHEDEEGRTPLHLAVMANRYSFVSYLLKNDARLEVRNFFLFFSD